MFDFLTTEGLIFLIVAWGSVLSLTAYCFFKVLSGDKNLDKTND